MWNYFLFQLSRMYVLSQRQSLIYYAGWIENIPWICERVEEVFNLPACLLYISLV